MEALGDYQTSPLFSDMEKLVLEYADAITQTPVEVSDTLFAKLRAKFTDAQLVELTATLAWENYRARFDHAFGMEAEGFTKGSYCAIPVRGARTSRAATP
jgi:4-carboxymuconolactone decarboxylase